MIYANIIKRALSICFVVIMLLEMIPESFADGENVELIKDCEGFAAMRNEPDWPIIETAYWKVITDYFVADIDDDLSPAHYALTDIDKDGIPELLVGMKGVSYSVTSVYTFSNNKAKLIGEIEEGHGSFYEIAGENGLLECYEAQGHIKITIWRKICCYTKSGHER